MLWGINASKRDSVMRMAETLVGMKRKAGNLEP